MCISKISQFLTHDVIASEGSLAVIAIPPLAGEAISKQLGINSSISILERYSDEIASSFQLKITTPRNDKNVQFDIVLSRLVNSYVYNQDMIKISKAVFLLLVGTLMISAILNFFFLRFFLDQNVVVKVVDGDSLDLKDGRRIRLLAIDAPERGRCMFEVGRGRLEEIVLNKRVRLEDSVTDDYGRMLTNVFIGEIFVNKVMLEEGLARFVYVKSPYYEELKQVSQLAKEQKRGIYSPLCRTSAKDDCLIKGNIRQGVKVYHLPSCDNYDQVIIDEAFGDQWFCTEDEAVKAGFRKAAGCKN